MEHPLLAPRYQVIADYPYSPYKIGEVLVDQMFRTGVLRLGLLRDSFPNIFNRLEWWEQRLLGEMPKYLMYMGETTSEFERHKTYEVVRWFRDEFPGSDRWTPCITFKDNACEIQDFHPAFEPGV